MKICPQCQTKYTDDTLRFCLQDGTLLIGERIEQPTVSFEESETVISPRNSAEQITQVRQNSAERNWNNSEVTRVSKISDEAKSSNYLVPIMLTALIMSVVFGIIGFGTYLYLNRDRTEVTKNSSGNNDNSEIVEENSRENPKPPQENKTSTPQKTTPTKPNQNAQNEEVSTPDPNPEETKQNVSNAVNNWKSQAEALNLDSYMNHYASTVDYYKKNGASKSFVRNDKQKAFSKFTSVQVNLSNMSVTPSSDGKSATVIFDKEWNFSGAESNSSGKVQQQLKLIKSGENWLIKSEKDLKVYYVNQ